MREPYYIYALGDPRDGGLFYVGATRSPWWRQECHAQTCPSMMRAYTEPHRLIKEAIAKTKLNPVFLVLEKTEHGERERYWHDRLLGMGYTLVNSSKRLLTARTKKSAKSISYIDLSDPRIYAVYFT